MKRAAVLVLLAGILALGAFLREVPAPGYRAPLDPSTGEPRPVRGVGEGGAPTPVVPPRWLVDDPDAAYHLRRVELALAGGSVPLRDRFLNHPAGSAVPWPPLLDGLLTQVASFGTLRTSEDLALAGHGEERIEGLLVHVPVVLGCLATLVVFLLTRFLCAPGAGSDAAALLAAAIHACLPIAIWYGGVTRIDHHVLVSDLIGLHLLALGLALRSRELTDATLGALLAGLVSGLALLAWLAAGVLVALGGLALGALALSADGDRARNGCRAGMLYFLVAAFTTWMPASRSPWNQIVPGSLINLTMGVPHALLAAALPFLALLIGQRAGLARPLRAGAAALTLVAAVLLLPGFLTGVAEGFAWASRGNLFMDVVEESRPLLGPATGPWWDTVVRDYTWVGFALPLAWLLLARHAGRSAERWLLAAVTAVFLGMTLTQRRFGNSLAVPLACTVGVALHGWRGALQRPGNAWRAAVLLALALPALGAAGVLRVAGRDLEDVADWRAQVVGGLRWMRTGTPSPGPWTSPESVQSYGVLSAWGYGHLIEYHARRPSIATNFGSFVGEENFRDAARALLVEDPAELERALHRLGADYVVVTPRMVSDLVATMRIAGLGPEQRARFFVRSPETGGRKTYGGAAPRTALWRLALTPPDAPDDHYPGLRRVWHASRRESMQGARVPAGALSGPVLSIYRLDSTSDERTAPVMRPR